MTSTTKDTCSVCKLTHHRLFFRYTVEEHRSHLLKLDEASRNKLQQTPASPASSAASSSFRDKDLLLAQPSEKFIQRAPEIELTTTQHRRRSTGGGSSSSPPPLSSDREVYCRMCYVIKFREYPQESHGTADRPVWSWHRFREKGFSFPFKCEQMKEHYCVENCKHANKKPVLIINTGGTLSCVPQKGNGLLSPAPLFEYLSTKVQAFTPNTGNDNDNDTPKLIEEKDLLKYSASKEIPFVMLENENLMIDSTNATFDEWNLIAMIISVRMQYYAGFVVIHGTDTLSYSASALTFSIFGQTCPVVVTGSQTPLRGVYGDEMLKGSTDAAMNLLGACDFCRHYPQLHGVFVYFHNKVFLGCRVVKSHSSNFDAFSAVNTGPLAFYNGEFTVNSRLLEVMNETRDAEVRALANHVKKFERYFRKYMLSQEELQNAEAQILEKLVGGSPALPSTTSLPQLDADEELDHNVSAELLDEKIRREYPSISPLERNCNPLTTTTPSDIIPFFDRRHSSSIQRFHREAKVLVFIARPGAVSGATSLQEQLIHHAVDASEPCAILVLGYGAGNCGSSVIDTLRWARQSRNIPCVFTTQTFAGASSSHYAVGLSREEGVNIFDQTFESAYTRLLLLLSQHIFIQCMDRKTREIDTSKFKRTREFRDIVEDWMSKPIRLCMTPDAESCKQNEIDEGLVKGCKVIRDSSVAMYS